jgi:RNA polymerase-binding transcription factor DksA
MIITVDDVYDEAELAEFVENQERESAIFNIVKDMPAARFDPSSIVTDPNKTCEECGDLIPEERQRVILTISKSCDYCAECQGYLNKLANR